MAVVFATIAAAGCASGRFVRPSGATTPFPEAAAVWSDLSGDCRSTTALRAELRVSGRVAGQRVPSLTTGVAVDPSRVALVAMAGARPVFHLAGDRDNVVLLNQVDATLTRGPAADVIDALVGIHLEPDRLLSILAGCASPDVEVTGADRVGAFGRIRTPETTIYLRERNDGWQVAAAEFQDITVDYRQQTDSGPRDIEVRRGDDVTLRLRVIELERNPQLSDALFSLRLPESFVEVPVDELRRSGPLAGSP